ncbi:unnamed protein product [Tilletia laevis]|uniref:Uncharacterized protein n=1 Tax=Tilletia laevis TaxID=157183 RepID=A0A9N8QHI6_9BASI|nr:unnamed protein product [Tilletia caries]CAD6941950.1 unnamed protein product [Tilletia laevis]CAD6959337.1 unnamed protein product [Tilletia laevis]
MAHEDCGLEASPTGRGFQELAQEAAAQLRKPGKRLVDGGQTRLVRQCEPDHSQALLIEALAVTLEQLRKRIADALVLVSHAFEGGVNVGHRADGRGALALAGGGGQGPES